MGGGVMQRFQGGRGGEQENGCPGAKEIRMGA